MVNFRRSLTWSCIVSILVASLFGDLTLALGQDSNSCTEVNEVAESCAVIPWISVERGKPFIAERVVRSSDHSFRDNDLIARDAAGRIYIEQHDLPWQYYSFSSHRDANTIWALGTASIFDCFGGKSIYLVPGSRTADIKQSCAGLQPFRQSNHPYTYQLTLLLIAKTPPNISVEDLGNKKIEGFQARGIRITWLGTEADGEWNRKPIRATEAWRSDELGATLLLVSSDFRKEVEFRTVLTNIRTAEPEASLFEVPAGYKISVIPQEKASPTGSSVITTQR